MHIADYASIDSTNHSNHAVGYTWEILGPWSAFVSLLTFQSIWSDQHIAHILRRHRPVVQDKFRPGFIGNGTIKLLAVTANIERSVQEYAVILDVLFIVSSTYTALLCLYYYSRS